MIIALAPDFNISSKEYQHYDFSQYCEYLAYREIDPTEKFDYEVVEIDIKIKIHNWNIVRLSKYLTLIIFNARDENYVNYVFETQLLHTKYYTEEDMKQKSLQSLLQLQDSPLWTINIEKRSKQMIYSLDNYHKFKSFNDLGSIVNLPLPEYKEEEVYIISSNCPHEKIYSSIRDDFSLQPYRTFFILNNISPNGSYHIKAPVYRNKINGHYRYDDPKSFFTSPTSEVCAIHRMTFDIESHTSKERPNGIADEHNIIYSFGAFIEYKGKNHAFVLMNEDFLVSMYVRERKPKFLSKFDKEHPSQTQLDAVYETIVRGEKKKKWSEYLDLLREEYPRLNSIKNVETNIDTIIKHDMRYILCSELNMIEFYRMSLTCFDQSIHFYGNNYDIPMLMRRYNYLTNLTYISKQFLVPSYYGTNIKIDAAPSHKKTKKVTRVEMNVHAQNIDVYNSVLLFYPREESYKLDSIAGRFFNFTAYSSPYKTNTTYKLTKIKYPSDVVKDSIYEIFKYVSYVSISGVTCIINREETDLDKDVVVIEQPNTSFIHLLNEKNVHVSMMKDDIRIFEVTFNTTNILDIVNYNIADCVLTFYAMMYLKYDENQLDVCNMSIMRPASYGKYETGVTLKGVIYALLIKEGIFFKKSDIIAEESIDGGFVIPPKEMFVSERCGMFDFNSLYPSIIISYNLSIENLLCVLVLKDEEEYKISKHILHTNLDKKMYSVTYIDSKFKIVIFALKYSNGNKFEGIIGKTCSILMANRKRVKAEMKTEKDPRARSLLDIKQNNLKINVNSIYGQISSINYPSIFTSPEVGECVTFKGRLGLMTLCEWFTNAKIDKSCLSLNCKPDDYNVFQEDTITDTSFNLQEYSENVKYWSTTPYNIDCIYGDTDSIMLKFVPLKEIDNRQKAIDVHIFLESIVNIINKKITHNKLVIECEKFIEWVALLAKKKYITKYTTFDMRWSPETVTTSKSSTQFKNTGNQRGFTKSHQEFVKKQMLEIFSCEKLNLEIIERTITMKLYTLFVGWIVDFRSGSVNYYDFVATSHYEGNYSDNFFKEILVVNHNKRTDIDETIAIGDRITYLYMCPARQEVTEPKEVNKYCTIYNPSDNYKDMRVVYEIYGKKCALSVLGPFYGGKTPNAVIKRLFMNLIAALKKNNYLPLI